MSTKIKENRDRILFWLKEEALTPEEVADPNAYFNFVIKMGDIRLNVIQPSRLIDSLFVGTKWTLSKEQIDLHKTILDDKKRLAYFWDLQLTLLSDNMLGDFQILPSAPNDFKELFVSSNRLFYDSLTKQGLMYSIFAVHKAMVKSVFLLERASDVMPPYFPIKK